MFRKFSSFEEQEAETIRYWISRTIAEKLEAAADLARQACGIRSTGRSGDDPRKPVPPVFNSRGERMPESRVLRKFGSFEEQEAWNNAHASGSD
jgi:hypothetical protein